MHIARNAIVSFTRRRPRNGYILATWASLRLSLLAVQIFTGPSV